MGNSAVPAGETSLKHFIKRARQYNCSSRWVDDPVLIGKICAFAHAGPRSYLLDIAIGTGKIAQAFYGKVKYVVGIDICEEMARQAKGCADRVVLAAAEKLPFQNNAFDVCVCRQGLQFMKLEGVFSEMRRVLKPGGKAVLCHLTAYGREDKEEAFFIQRLRNPARKNFFSPQDLAKLLKKNNFTDIESIEYITRESVNQWIDHGAITKDAREEIRESYRKASDGFKRIHDIRFKNGDIFDSMKMVLVKARKKKQKA